MRRLPLALALLFGCGTTAARPGGSSGGTGSSAASSAGGGTSGSSGGSTAGGGSSGGTGTTGGGSASATGGTSSGTSGGCPAMAPCQPGQLRSESCGDCGVETDQCSGSCAWILGACDTAVQGSLHASPSRLVLAPGAVGKSSIAWSVSGAAGGEVWLSVAGAPEKLFAAGPAGTQLAPWITAPGPYVFSLYAGSTHATRLAYVSVVVGSEPSAFGFDYWPHGESSAALTSAHWSPALEATIAADLDRMVSLGTRLVRLIVWPEANGFRLAQGAGGTFTAEYGQSLANLPALLALFAARKLQVILVFGDDWLVYDASGTQLTWWQWAYGPSGFPAFLSDCVRYFSGFVQAAEGSGYASTVLYYDLQNEVHDSELDVWPYVRGLYDQLPIPPGKRGISLLDASTDTAILTQQLECRRLDYVDLHVYPQSGENVPLGASYAAVAGAFPDSVALVGELGAPCPDAGSEPAQQSTVLGLLDEASDAGVPYALNWMLWDDAPPAANQIFGVGYAPDAPKDLLGGLAARSLVPNGDLEQVAGGLPVGWTGGGAGAPVTVTAMGPQRSDAATNDFYGRVSSAGQPSLMWISSPLFAVPGGGVLVADGYVRSNGANVQLVIHPYDAAKRPLAPIAGSSFTPNGWSWNDDLEHAGSQRFPLPQSASYALVSFSVQPTGAPAYLDVDAVSASISP